MLNDYHLSEKYVYPKYIYMYTRIICINLDIRDIGSHLLLHLACCACSNLYCTGYCRSPTHSLTEPYSPAQATQNVDDTSFAGLPTACSSNHSIPAVSPRHLAATPVICTAIVLTIIPHTVSLKHLFVITGSPFWSTTPFSACCAGFLKLN